MFRVALFLLLGAEVQADRITVAVASNFTNTMQGLVQAFESQSEHSVRLSSASSGKIFAQIKHGAPFDLFFSADSHKPRALIGEGLAVGTSLVTYAKGGLVLWASNAEINLTDAKILGSDVVRTIALANPKFAPYGSAAVEVLNALNMTEQTKRKWVIGENISQTFQFAVSGNADVGFIALAQLSAISSENYWIVPEALYSPIEQDAVLLTRSNNPSAAREFLAFIQTAEAKNIIKSFGYKVDTQ